MNESDGSISLWFGTNTDVCQQRAAAAERELLLQAERAARTEAERVAHEGRFNGRGCLCLSRYAYRSCRDGLSIL
jgi:hypothetical protein